MNSYTISLTAGVNPGIQPAPLPRGTVPLADKDVEVWCVARDAPGYDSWNSKPLAERMKLGGKSITLHTDALGQARLELPEFDGVASIHASYQLVIRFNANHQYPDYNSAQLPQLEFYANSGLDQ